jgi:acyl-[acyl carrier protein]--UDP-N-acetylglucosamine O-acyltransferase
MPGHNHGKSIKRPRVYEALRRKGFSKEKAARISNAGRTPFKRHQMAKKAARTRKRHGH